jgi:hypothetical protein
LSVEDFFGESGLAFGEQFADAEDWGDPPGDGGIEFAVEHCVGFPEQGTAFAVTDEHVLAAAVFEHFAGGFARERSGSFEVDVLSPESDGAAGDSLGDWEQVREGGADEHFDAGVFAGRNGSQFTCKLDSGAAKGVHLPVSGDQKPTHGLGVPLNGVM